jgi:PKHD-type hydroxylase
MFMRIPQVLTPDQLAAIRTALGSDKAPWVDGRVTAGHQGALVKSNQQLEQGSAMASELGTLIVEQLERNSDFISAALPHRVYPPMFNRYDTGMHFGIHVDGAIRQIPGTSGKLRTDLSATIFLVPPDSYDGGELVIDSDDGNGSQQAKLTAGDLILYTATRRHHVNAVTRGQRLACVFWIQSLIRDDARREQLFELDRTIQRLTQSAVDPESLVRLAGHYHNLLRLWADL